MPRFFPGAAAWVVVLTGLACSTSHEPTGTQTPDTPAGRQLAYVLGLINGGAALVTADQLVAHMTPDLQTQLPPESLIGALQTINSKQATVTLSGFDGAPSPTSLLAIGIDKNTQYLRIDLGTESVDPYRINRLGVFPSGDLDPQLNTWDKVNAALRAISPSIGFLAAGADTSTCTAIDAVNAGSELSLGSNFKLYVLATLANQIEAGLHKWTDVVPIRDDWKSISPLEFEEDGTPHTLQDLATQMIVQSDNTAADHLIFTLNRLDVQVEFAATGHSQPELDDPLLTTWDFFVIELLLSAKDRAAYIASSPAQKSAMIAKFPRTSAARDMVNAQLAAWTMPEDIDTVGWFASPYDLCNVIQRLKAYGAKPATAPTLDILFTSHGLPDPRGDWSKLGYKAGSEAGVLSTTYLLERARDHKSFFMSMIVNDKTGTFDRDQAFYVLGAARGLLSQE